MMETPSRLRDGLMLLVVVLGVHVFLGLYAVYFDGIFSFGATMPERYVVYLLSDRETTFNPTGSILYHINDLCLQDCAGCDPLCYPYSNIRVDCDSCVITKADGVVLARSGQFFEGVAKKLVVFYNVSFMCYDLPSAQSGQQAVGSSETTSRTCGFEEEIGVNTTFIHTL